MCAMKTSTTEVRGLQDEASHLTVETEDPEGTYWCKEKKRDRNLDDIGEDNSQAQDGFRQMVEVPRYGCWDALALEVDIERCTGDPICILLRVTKILDTRGEGRQR